MELKNFVDLNEVEKVLVFAWRNHLKIAPFQRTQTISLKEHLEFLESLRDDRERQYFLVLEEEVILGVICFIKIERGVSCEFGIYQNPDLKGFGKVLMQEVLKFAFKNLKVKTLYACALNHNAKALALYREFGLNLTHKDATMSYFELSAGGGGIF